MELTRSQTDVLSVSVHFVYFFDILKRLFASGVDAVTVLSTISPKSVDICNPGTLQKAPGGLLLLPGFNPQGWKHFQTIDLTWGYMAKLSWPHLLEGDILIVR